MRKLLLLALFVAQLASSRPSFALSPDSLPVDSSRPGNQSHLRQTASLGLLGSSANLIGPYWTTEEASSSALFINNPAPSPVETELSLFDAGGTLLQQRRLQLGPSESRNLDLETIVGAGLRGYLKLKYPQEARFPAASVLVSQGGASWSVDLANEASLQRRSERTHALIPPLNKVPELEPGNQETWIVLTNLAEAPVSGRWVAQLDHTSRTEPWQIGPREMKVMQVRSLTGRFTEPAGVVVEASTGSPAVIITGFSRICRGVCRTVALEFHSPLPGSREIAGFFEGADSLVSLWNTADHPSFLTLSARTLGSSDPTASIRLEGGERKAYVLRDLLDLEPGAGGVLSLETGEQDRVIAEVVSSRSGPSPSDTATPKAGGAFTSSSLRDTIRETYSGHSFPVRLGSGLDTKIRLYNPNDSPVEVSLFLHFGSSGYTHPLKSLRPHQALEIDLLEVRDKALPGQAGRYLPENAEVGQAKLILHGQPEESLLAEAVLESESLGRIASFSCQTCPFEIWFIDLEPESFVGLVGDSSLAQVFAYYIDGEVREVSPFSNYTVDNPLVASVQKSFVLVNLNFTAPGNALVTAVYQDCAEWIYDFQEDRCFCANLARLTDTSDIHGFKITLSAAAITPGAGVTAPTTQLTVDLGNDPLGAMSVTLETSVEKASGGHSHEIGGTARPPAQLENAGTWNKTQTYTTTSRMFSTMFRPAMGDNNTARGIAGKYKVTADFLGKTGAGSKTLEVKYGLFSLGSGTNYCLRSVDSRHNSGDYHYGTSAANTMIRDIADKFFNDHGKNQTPQQVMVVNDQSLVWGGLFEVPASSEWDFNQGHKEHRDGNDVDIPYKVCEGGAQRAVSTSSTEWSKLRDAVSSHCASFVQEDSKVHFHCRK